VQGEIETLLNWIHGIKCLGVDDNYENENDQILHNLSNHDERLKNSLLRLYNSFNFELIVFKTANELEFDEKLNNVHKKFIQQLNNLENENGKLKECIRNNSMEIHYLKLNNEQKNIKYNYQEIKNKNKSLNNEFKRVYKLISKNIGFNLISQ
jgi:hypothetical protein